jgi:polar amino acid transport system substrate-binding protein
VEIDNQLHGYDVDILDLINEYTGANFKLKTGNWDDIVEMAKNNEIDGLSASASHKSRENHFLFSNPYVTIRKMVIAKKTNKLLFKTQKDLENKTVVIRNGNLLDENYVKSIPGSIIVYAEDHNDLILKLINGDADYTIGSSDILYFTNVMGMPVLDFCFATEVENQLVFSVRKDWPEAITILNKGIKLISPSIQHQLFLQWFQFSSIKESIDIDFTIQEREYLKNNPNIKICIDPHWGPYEYLNDNKKHAGITKNYYDYFRKVLGVNFELVLTKNWLETLEKAKNNECDIIATINKTPEREKYLSFTEPYLSLPLAVVTKKKHIIDDIGFYLDKKYCYIKGYAEGELLKNKYSNINLYEVDTIEEGVKDVETGKAFGHINIKYALLYELERSRFKDLHIGGLLDLESTNTIGVQKENKILLSIFNKLIKSISETKHVELQNPIKPTVIYHETSILYKIFLFSLLLLSIILLLFSVILIIRYKRLKKLIKQQQKDLAKYNKDNLNKVCLEKAHALAVTVNHELSQPLMTLSANFEMFINSKKGRNLDPDEKKYFTKIESSVIRIQAILEKYRKNTNLKYDKYSEDVDMINFFHEENIDD